MGVHPLNSVDSVTGVVPGRTFKNQTNNNALRPGLKPIRSRIFANGRHLRWVNNFFRGLAWSVQVINAHRTPNEQMKIKIFESDEVAASDLTRDKNVSFFCKICDIS